MEKVTMTVAELGEVMGLSKPKAYELASRCDFPCLQVGRRKLIPVDAFKRWLDAQTSARDTNAQKGAV
jgi:excisionase family DNA binding protein